jgi:tetratricopeptide (TPR) repeat protein
MKRSAMQKHEQSGAMPGGVIPIPRPRDRNDTGGLKQAPALQKLLLGSFILCLFLVVPVRVLVATGPGQESPSRTHHDADVSTLLRTAQDALGRNDFAAAADALKQVVEAQPTLTAAWFNLAYAYTGLHKQAEAVASYRKALALDPNLFEARLNLGILLIQLNDPQAALEHLEKAATLKPDHLRAQLYYGRALALTGQTERAEKQYQTVLRIDPKLASAHYDLGQLYLQQKRYQEALDSFQKASERDPTLSQAQLGMALAVEGLKDEVNAAGHFEQYLAARPDDLETRFHLARLYLEQGKNQQAYEGLQSVYRLKPETPGLAAALGDVCALLKRFPESENFYRQALLAMPADPDLHRALGQTLLEEEKLSEAEVEFRTAVKSDPRNHDAGQGLATSLYLQKRYPEAIPLLETLARAPNPPAITFFALATCYDNLHVLRKALDNYERFLQLSKGQSPDHEWQATQRAKLLRHQLEK